MSYKKKNPDVIFDFEQNALKSDCDISITTNGAKSTKSQNFIKWSSLRPSKKSVYRMQSKIKQEKTYSFIFTITNKKPSGECRIFLTVACFFRTSTLPYPRTPTN